MGSAPNRAAAIHAFWTGKMNAALLEVWIVNQSHAFGCNWGGPGSPVPGRCVYRGQCMMRNRGRFFLVGGLRVSCAFLELELRDNGLWQGGGGGAWPRLGCWLCPWAVH